MLLLPLTVGEMKVELIQPAAGVLFDVPDDTHEESTRLITAVAKDPEVQVPGRPQRLVNGAGLCTPPMET
ncbi:hypothetical protein WJ438_37345 [Streptomyces sp. GD-15H]|uniref:hypothetical protein n=1 Tax=Streptomyces sp. GD-15H TaxID=3129112 RepID=UPI00325686DD